MSETLEVYGNEIEKKIYLIRGRRVMLSTDLARMYGVEAKALIQAVKRNVKRFPSDFMFALEWQEVGQSRSQFVTLNGKVPQPLGSHGTVLKRGHNVKYPPYAFTEQGVAMLSGILRSDRAVAVNIAIMRAFVTLREALGAHKELALKLAELERQIKGHDANIQTLFDAIHQLMNPPEQPRKQIGFHLRENCVCWGCDHGLHGWH